MLICVYFPASLQFRKSVMDEWPWYIHSVIIIAKKLKFKEIQSPAAQTWCETENSEGLFTDWCHRFSSWPCAKDMDLEDGRKDECNFQKPNLQSCPFVYYFLLRRVIRHTLTKLCLNCCGVVRTLASLIHENAHLMLYFVLCSNQK